MQDPSAWSDVSAARVAVVGDLMLDRTRWVDEDESSADSLQVLRQSVTEDHPGGAGHVVRLLQSFGVAVDVFGVVGADREGIVLRNALNRTGSRLFVPTDPSRPTTLKERLVSGTSSRPRVLSRIDHESVHPLCGRWEEWLRDSFSSVTTQCRGVLISDYAKGVCSTSLVSAVIAAARSRGLVVVVDPSRRLECEQFAGCDVLTPNRPEAERLSGMTIDSLAAGARAGQRICQRSRADACVVTMDADGALLTTAGGHSVHVPAVAAEVVDTTGAGDAFAAALLLQLVHGRSLSDAVKRANVVAARQVRRFGTLLPGERPFRGCTATSAMSSLSKVCRMDEIAEIAARLRMSGSRIVLTNGCFDLLHPGHVGYLEQAAAEGDCLIVALNADASIRALKGQGRPIMTTDERARMLSALACVDYVIVFDEPTPHEVIQRVQPDVLVKGGDYAVEDVVGRELVESAGGQVRTLGLTPGLSTSRILQRMSGQPERVSLSDAG